MRYHRLMQSVKTRNGRRAYLWWLDHYTYEIELDDDTIIPLNDTPIEEAEQVLFRIIEEN